MPSGVCGLHRPLPGVAGLCESSQARHDTLERA